MKESNKKIWLLAVALVGVLYVHPAHAAIAIDSTSADGAGDFNDTNTSKTFAFNNVAGNMVVVGCESNGDNIASTTGAITYGGDNMTLAVKNVGVTGGSNLTMQWWYKTNAKTGSNNVVITESPGTQTFCGAQSYTGNSTVTDPIDATSTRTLAQAINQKNVSISLTPVGANTWMVAEYMVTGGFTITASTGTTKRWASTIQKNLGGDSNAALTAGVSNSMFADCGTNNAAGWSMAAFTFLPAASAPTGYSHRINGVTSPTKVNGVTLTSTSKINGL